MFTSNTNERTFGTAVDRVLEALNSNGYTVELARRTEQFARVHVRTDAGQQVAIDMGMDWREAEPVALDVGPVLSIQGSDREQGLRPLQSRRSP